MVEFVLDDEDRDGSSADEQDELLEEADQMDVDAEADADADGDGDDDEDEDNADEEDDDEEEESEQPLSQVRRPANPTTKDVNGGPTSHPQPELLPTSPTPNQGSAPLASPRIRYEVRSEALNASTYDIVPTMAAPQSTSINCITATPDMRYWFSGGSDCYIRKYDGVATANGKTLLTVAQRHPFVDSVTKAGVLMSYWDNEEPTAKSLGEEAALSPVYALAVQSQAVWMLSGLESGSINLYSVRHDEGKRIAYMHKHKSAVSVLTLAQDEKSVLSGSWDKQVFDWDLNTGQIKRAFEGCGGQTAAIEIRPASSLAVPEELGEPLRVNGTFSSNNDVKPVMNGTSNGTVANVDDNEDAPGSPADSLFGGGSENNSLFGETTADGAPSGGGIFGDDDDLFSRAIESNLESQPVDSQGDISMGNGDASVLETAPAVQNPTTQVNGSTDETQTNGVSHAETNSESLAEPPSQPSITTQDPLTTSDSTFLAASIDGTLRIWDRRAPNPIASIRPQTGVPPWCMAACWSPDGNFIYAGRRNGTVEEYSLHKGLKRPERTFKFPGGSGAVSCLRAMPSGKHLICASHDILRLYDLKDTSQQSNAKHSHSTVPFLIVPGPPRAGVISALHIDPTCKFMLSAAGNRGWEGTSTEVLIGYEIGCMP